MNGAPPGPKTNRDHLRGVGLGVWHYPGQAACISAAQCDGDTWVGQGSWLLETHGATAHSGYSVWSGVQCVQLELK